MLLACDESHVWCWERESPSRPCLAHPAPAPRSRVIYQQNGEPPSGSRLQSLCSGKGRTGEKARGDPCADCSLCAPRSDLSADSRTRTIARAPLCELTLRSPLDRSLFRHSISRGPVHTVSHERRPRTWTRADLTTLDGRDLRGGHPGSRDSRVHICHIPIIRVETHDGDDGRRSSH